MNEGKSTSDLSSPGERVEFGHSRVEWLRLADINELAQTRQSYDPEAIAELARSMCYEDESGQRHFELINDLTMASFSDDELEQYLVEHEAFYGSQSDTTDFSRADDGQWYILIAGHRRRRAIEKNCLDAGINVDDAYVAISLRPSISFEEALVLQLRENIHLRPPVTDEARQIERYYHLRSQRERTIPSIASCARILGFSETKVSEALRYAQLPTEVQNEVTSGLMSFSHAIQMHNYMQALEKYYPMKYGHLYRDETSARTLQEDVTSSMMTLIKTLKSKELNGANARKKSEIIKANINTILEATTYHDGELFVLEEDMTPVRRRRVAEQRLGAQALMIALQRLSSGMLSPQEQDMLVSLRSLLDARENSELRAMVQTDTLLEFDIA